MNRSTIFQQPFNNHVVNVEKSLNNRLTIV